MSKITSADGKCLCGAVTIHANKLNPQVGVCHCSTCRGWSGGPLFAVDCLSEVTINGLQKVKTYQSSEWAERGFCMNCGTHLFYRIKQNNSYIIPVGIFGDNLPLELDHQIFVEEKPDYYHFVETTIMMTGAEVFAAAESAEK